MRTVGAERPRAGSAVSADATSIGYVSVGQGQGQGQGQGPGLVIVGGVLSSASDYLPLAGVLARDFEVHVMDGDRPKPWEINCSSAR